MNFGSHLAKVFFSFKGIKIFVPWIFQNKRAQFLQIKFDWQFFGSFFKIVIENYYYLSFSYHLQIQIQWLWDLRDSSKPQIITDTLQDPSRQWNFYEDKKRQQEFKEKFYLPWCYSLYYYCYVYSIFMLSLESFNYNTIWQKTFSLIITL